MNILTVENLVAGAGEKMILNGLSFAVDAGESVAIMGPNGSGKSTLASVLMGNPHYQIHEGSIIFRGQDITHAKPEERATAGLFLAFQEPREVAGLELFPFLFDSYKSLETARGKQPESVFAFKKRLDSELESLRVKSDWSQRHLNDGFSGGEKKKSELLQLALSSSTLAILDEIDSGLDVDALKSAGEAMKRFKNENTAIIAITHYQRAMEYIRPDRVLVMVKGRIAASGGPDLALRLEQEGFAGLGKQEGK
ncbi:MAG: Fe-S cluster assembly ATPase SufC [Bacillota bacterium]